MNSRNFPNNFNGKLNVIGTKIRQFRQKRNLTEQELSNRLLLLGIDIPVKSIYHIEIGTRTVLDFEICGIAKVLNISVQDLLEDYYSSLDNI